MFSAQTPIGSTILVPESRAEDPLSFGPDELASARRFYDAEGYVVVRELVPVPLCARTRAAFDAVVRQAPTPILRQQNMRYERNRFDARGHLANPIFNVQDLETGRFGAFKHAALDILTAPATRRLVAALLAGPRTPEPVKLIQSMFFEAGVGTWPHQDSYYQDSAGALGSSVAGWFALETVAAGAGRFYVLPRSHRVLPVIRNEGALAIAGGHARYKEAVLEAVRSSPLRWHAPYLEAGDVLFWNSCTVHGSLSPAPDRTGSRASLTAHYLRESDSMLQFHSRIRRQKVVSYNGASLGLLHDQDAWHNRLVRTLAFRWPNAWALLRSAAIRTMLAIAQRHRETRAPLHPAHSDAVTTP